MGDSDNVETVLHSYRDWLRLAPRHPEYANVQGRLSALPPITLPLVTLDELSDGTSLLGDGGVSTGRFVGSRVHHRFADAVQEVLALAAGPMGRRNGEGMRDNDPERVLLRPVAELVEREHVLRQQLSDPQDQDRITDRAALRSLEEELDQCWDLLRQQRARRPVHRAQVTRTRGRWNRSRTTSLDRAIPVNGKDC